MIRNFVNRMKTAFTDLVDKMDDDPSEAKLGSGKRIISNFVFDNFSKIRVESKNSKISARVNVIVGSADEYLTLEIDDNLREVILVEVSNRCLIIKNLEKYLSKGGLLININIRALENVSAEGDVVMKILGFNNKTLSAQINGLVQLYIEGQVISQQLEVNGSCLNMDLSKLVSREAKLVINGSCNARVNVSEKLDVILNGTGSVSYRGNPTTITRRINGVGFINSED